MSSALDSWSAISAQAGVFWSAFEPWILLCVAFPILGVIWWIWARLSGQDAVPTRADGSSFGGSSAGAIGSGSGGGLGGGTKGRKAVPTAGHTQKGVWDRTRTNINNMRPDRLYKLGKQYNEMASQAAEEKRLFNYMGKQFEGGFSVKEGHSGKAANRSDVPDGMFKKLLDK